MLDIQQNRIFDDLITAERGLRTSAENSTRRLLALLIEIASRLDGTRYEEMRKQDPSIPARWTVDDWRNYFLSIRSMHAPTAGWNADQDAALNCTTDKRITEQLAQLSAAFTAEKRKTEMLISENNRLHAAQPRFERKAKHQAPAVTPATATAAQPLIEETMAAAREPSSYPGILADFGEFIKTVSSTPPLEYKELGDGNRPWKRYCGIIYLIGRWGINSKQELMRLMGDEEGIGGNSTSLTNILENLRDYGYLISDVLEIDGAEMKIAFWRLTTAGHVLFQRITESAPVECEWSRLIRLRDGEKNTSYVSACLTFAFHARKRGWGVKLLPSAAGSFDADIMIQRGDEYIFVLMTSGNENKSAVWQSLAAANHGILALCTANASQRTIIVSESRQQKLSGIATDIQTLSVGGYSNVHANSDIWVESWQ